MINGLYSSASGMNAELLEQDTIANNLANVSTAGFKRDDAVFEAFPETLVNRINDNMKQDSKLSTLTSGLAMAQTYPSQPLGILGHGVAPGQVVTDFSDGSTVRTDLPLDFALHGNALFTIQKSDGSYAYTRSGTFTENSQGLLTTMAGDLVMGVGDKPIRVDGQSVVVDSTGRFLVDGVETGTFQYESWDPSKMEKQGENLYVRQEPDIEAVENDAPQGVNVTQGYIEQSNSSVIKEMVDMIVVSRAYEANQKAIQVQDNSLSEVINQVGKPS